MEANAKFVRGGEIATSQREVWLHQFVDFAYGTFKMRKNIRSPEVGRFETTAMILVCGKLVRASYDGFAGTKAVTRVHVDRLVEPSTS